MPHPTDLERALSWISPSDRELYRRTSNIRTFYKQDKEADYQVEFAVDPQDGNAITGIERIGGNEYLGRHNGAVTSYSGNYRIWVVTG